MHPDKQHPRRNHNLYRTLIDANTKADDAELSSCHVPGGFDLYPHIPYIVCDLPKPGLLHTMPIGMPEHYQKWIFHFMKMHEWLDKYNAIWFSVPAYHNLTPKNKSYEEVSQWNGKEMKEMSWYLLGVVTHSLRGGIPTQRPIFNREIECTRALLEFYMYARYPSHDDATLSYLPDSFHHFHTFNDVRLLGRAGAKAKAKANALRTEPVKKRNVDVQTNAETCKPSKKRHEMNAWWDYITHEIYVSNELDTDFNFPKIHLMSHWAEQVRQYGALQQYSAKRHEQAHQTNLKDSWNTSNHNLNYLPQVITFQRRILCFEIRELNPRALAQYWENGVATCKVFPSGADLAALLSSQSYVKPEFVEPQNRRDGNHSDPMTKDFRSLLDKMQDATNRAPMDSGTREFIKHQTRNKTYISHEQLHAMELCIYHSIKVQVESLEGERISQMCRCTGSQSWS